MSYDEAYKGLDALAIRNFGDRPVFLSWNGGREALVAYLVAFSQLFFGYSSLSVRMVSAVMGCLTLFLFFLLVRRWFSERLAIISTFLLAVSKWHLIHSRYGSRASEVTVFEVGVLYALLRGFSSPKRSTWWFLLGGILGALGFYSYASYRVFPLVILAFLLQAPVRRALMNHRKSLIAAGLVFLAILAPLGVYLFTHPETFKYRMEVASVWSRWSETRGETGTQKILESTGKTLGLFTLQGDIVAGDNVYAEPMLAPLAAPFFLLGFVILLLNIRKTPMLVLLIYFVVTLLPSIFSSGAPNAYRTLGCLAPTFLIIGFGIIAAIEIIPDYARVTRTAVLVMILGANMLLGLYDSFVRYPDILDNLPVDVSEAWGLEAPPSDVANALNHLGSQCVAFVSPRFFFHTALEYLTYGQSKFQLMIPGTRLENEVQNDDIAVVMFERENSNLWWLSDEEGLDLFKWWRQAHRLQESEILSAVEKSYGSKTTKVSDRWIIGFLKKHYPGGTYLNFDRFSIYIVKLSRSN
ncbi:MAG TPA: glycosyltransferase family 39 protein [Acidobacteriota bacterium]|nr:glycosyltransferase family 39 protein [Acidobacteriota bacterium]